MEELIAAYDAYFNEVSSDAFRRSTFAASLTPKGETTNLFS
jgi:hypothetical protein